MSIQRYVARTLTAVTGPDLRDDSGVVVLYPDHLAALAELESTKVVLKAGGTYVLFPDHLKEIEEAFRAGHECSEEGHHMTSTLAAYLKAREGK